MMPGHESRLEMLERRHEQVRDTLYGSWDAEMQQRHPGVIETVQAIDKKIDRATMVAVRVLLPLIVLIALRSLGVPTQDVAALLAKFVSLVLHAG